MVKPAGHAVKQGGGLFVQGTEDLVVIFSQALVAAAGYDGCW